MTFKLAGRVRLSRDVSLEPHTVLRSGETGVIVRLEKDSQGVYEVEIHMDKRHRGLSHWDNQALLVHPELSAVVCVTQWPTVSGCGALAASALVELAGRLW
jgi:hypothetical protein